LLVGAKIVNPQFLRPRLFAGHAAVKEQHLGLHALGIEDARGQAQQRMHIACPQLDARSSWPNQPNRDDTDPVAQHARRFALWAFHGVSDAKVHDRTFELAHVDLNRRPETAP